MSKNIYVLITFKQMFEYERLYNIKVIDKTFHIRRWKYFHHVPKVKGVPITPNPDKNAVFLSLIVFNFKRATILHNYLIYFYSST